MNYEAFSLSNVWKGHFEAIDDRCNDARCAAVVSSRPIWMRTANLINEGQ
jgi:hypothetical protein